MTGRGTTARGIRLGEGQDDRFVDGWAAACSPTRTSSGSGVRAPGSRTKVSSPLASAITYSGVPFGSLLAALLGILLHESIGRRGLFWIGALPLVTLLPLAYLKMPESVTWLVSRNRIAQARQAPR